MRLLERLIVTRLTLTEVYGALLVNKHMVGKYRAVNWNNYG